MSTPIPIEIKGVQFSSLRKASIHYGISYDKIMHRLKTWTIDEAFEIKPRTNLECPCFVYRIKNKINGNRYIGITTVSLKERFRQHKNDANKGSNSKFHKAIRKYGIGNFSIKLLKETDNRLKLRELEIKYINKYNTIRKGYNSLSSGCGLGLQHGVCVEYKGIVYTSIRSLARFLGIREASVAYRLKNNILLDTVVVPKVKKYENIEYKGKIYKNVKELSEIFNLSPQNIRYKLDNKIDLDKPNIKSIHYRGKVYKSACQLGKVIGVDASLIHYRIRRNYCINGKPEYTGCKGYYKAKYV